MLISIAIPVYNQSAPLLLTLSSVVDLLESLDPSLLRKIEVLLADNCSDDSAIIKEALKGIKVDSIRYFRHEQNLGFTNNFNFLIDNSKAQYIWFLGAGETVDNKAANKFLSELENTDFNVITLASKPSNSKSSNLEFASISSSTKWGEHILFDPTFACTIFNVNRISEVIPEIVAKNEPWPHVDAALTIHSTFSDKPQTLGRFSIPTVNIYRDEHGWWNKQQVFFNILNLYQVMDWHSQNTTNSELRKAIDIQSSAGDVKILAQWIIAAKIAGVSPNRIEFLSFVKRCSIEKKNSWFLLLALFTPRLVIKTFAYIFRLPAVASKYKN